MCAGGTHLSFRMNNAPSWMRTVEAKTAKTSSLSNLKRRRKEQKPSSTAARHNLTSTNVHNDYLKPPKSTGRGNRFRSR